jgi:guanine deaminase
MTDKEFLARAVKLAEAGIVRGDGPFGALVVRNGEILAESTNTVVQSNDPTAHAEILAIREAAKKTGTHNLTDCVLYSSCEPCPMCIGAIYWSGISKVYFAANRKDAAAAGFNDEFIYNEISQPLSGRKILFNKLNEVDGSEVFRKWIEYEKKIPY